MKHLPICAAAALVLALSFTALAAAQIEVGVKSGDYIEYLVSYTGAPAEGHDVTWARMEILNVANPEIKVEMTSHFADNTSSAINSTLNLATGHLIDVFIIPANLNVGDTFIDEHLGNVTIGSSETRTYAGAARTVLISKVGDNTYVWDQKTGVSLEGNTKNAQFTVRTITAQTNMWTPQPSPEPQTLDFTSVVLVFAFGTIVLAFALVLSARYIRKKAKQKHELLQAQA